MRSTIGRKKTNSGRSAKWRVLIVTIAVAGAVTALLAGGLRERTAHAAVAAQATPTPTPTPVPPPADYSKKGDFLNGRRLLLRSDDFLIGYTATNSDATDPRSSLLSATTANSVPTLRAPEQDASPVTLNPTEFAAGRFFQTGYDIALQFQFNGGSRLYDLRGFVSGGESKLKDMFTQQMDFIPGNLDVTLVSAVADFNGDGYDDIALGNRNPGTLRVLTAVDVKDPQKGFKIGGELTLNLDPARPDLGLDQITVGDFNGDGVNEIAGMYLTNNTAIHVGVYSVKQQTLAISPSGTVDLVQSSTGFPLLQIAAGRFNTSGHDQLLAAWLINQNGSDTCKVATIDFGGALQPKVISTWDSGDFGGGDKYTPFTMKLKTARFDWTGNFDQAVWMVGSPGTGTRLSILKINPETLTISRPGDTTIQPYPQWHGMELAIGNFDRKKASIADPTETERDPNPQVGVMGRDMTYKITDNDEENCEQRTNNCYKSFLNIYSVDPQTFAITQSSGVLLDENYMNGVLGGRRVVNRFWLLPTDLQGRSLRLGGGYRITVERAAPSVVLAAPPMHADYINPVASATPTVLNLSVAPDGFNSEYEETDSQDATSTSKSKTSSTFAAEEKVSATVSYGESNILTGELENGIKVTDAFTAKQDIKNSSEATNGTFSSTEFKISQETGLSDVVWFKDTSYYLYIYEVLGQKICPANKPNCAEGEKVPLQVIFSAPKEATVQRIATDTLEWYQPPWEYGNIFSYPASLAQLKLYLPDISLLTQEGTIFATDDASATLETTWSNGKTTGQSVAHEQLFSEENDLSIEGKTDATVFGFGVNVDANVDFNIGGSNGLETLTESENRINSAQGITIQKRSIFADPFSYKYFFSPYIFGKQEPTGISDPVITDADLVTFGALRSAFTADPLSSGAGGWWRQTYSQLPDVALNHPNRWSYGSSPRPATGAIPSNCVAVSASAMNCVEPAERAPENPWLDPFHDMRGLFITKADTPGQGPQQQFATVGDKMSLQTRVYNYSLKALPAGSKVKVRFYGMEWNTSLNVPSKADGESFLIGETTLDPIPPFSDDSGAPLNWVLAGTTFDTTAYENKFLVFWVVAWAEDTGGKLVTEIVGHGLTAVPANTTNQTFKTVAGLEELVDDPLSTATTPPKVSFSNNLGFYRLPFYVGPKTSAPTLGAPAKVNLGRVQVDAGLRQLGQKIEVSSMLRGGRRDLYGVPVYFYDGDPQAGGRLFDVERLAALRAGDRHKVNIHFRPQECGEHKVFITVGKGTDYEVTKSSPAFAVRCPQPPGCEKACLRAPQYYANNLWTGLPTGQVWIAGVARPVSTRNMWAISKALKGGNSAAERFNRQYVALQLSVLKDDLTGDDRSRALAATLSCYGLEGGDLALSDGARINAATTLGELLAHAESAARANRAVDLGKLAGVLDFLNSDDPQGSCNLNAGRVTRARAVTPTPTAPRWAPGKQASGAAIR